jgi:hypothetical protein
MIRLARTLTVAFARVLFRSRLELMAADPRQKDIR